MKSTEGARGGCTARWPGSRLSGLIKMKLILKRQNEKKPIAYGKPSQRGSPLYGLACQLQILLDLPMSLCFRLLKKHSPEELAPLIKWWKDYPGDKENNIGLIIGQLKYLYPEKYVKQPKENKKKKPPPLLLFRRPQNDSEPLLARKKRL